MSLAFARRRRSNMKTIQTLTIGATLFTLAVTASIARADDQKSHEDKFCVALSAVDDDLAKLDAIAPSSTVRELQAATDQIRKDADAATKQARKIKSPTAKQFTEAANQL